MKKTVIVWFRQDLRLDDNPALLAAIQDAEQVIPLYIWSPEEDGSWTLGGASRWWLHHSLQVLDENLRQRGSMLVIKRGRSAAVIIQLARQFGAKFVYWNRLYEPAVLQRDIELTSELEASAICAESYNGSLLFEPWRTVKEDKTPYQVFTPFWNKCLSLSPPPEPVSAPEKLPPLPDGLGSLPLEELKITPHSHWDKGLAKSWIPGEDAARQRMDYFLKDILRHYYEGRDYPAKDLTSRLSPYLHFGEISPRRLWYACRSLELMDPRPGIIKGTEEWLRELGWREFGYHLLFHFPKTPEQPLREQYSQFPWTDDYTDLRLWNYGLTGYPIVDAGMRQLWTTGWMHNRVRMIVASFLVKDLMIPWTEGSRWFWDTLVDADLACNTLGWQWAAGCGADAAPYFRIFNPSLQGKKFDPTGDYIRKYVPELTDVPHQYIHTPWEAPHLTLFESGVELGKNYPYPIVDHAEARQRALSVFEGFKKK